jgi:tape measure domain-containing protein
MELFKLFGVFELKGADKAKSDIEAIEDKAAGMGGRFSALGGIVAGAAAGIAGAVSVIGGAVGAMGIKFNASMEQSEIAWTTLLGSADAAKERIQTLLDLGARTPFEFEGLDKSAKLLDMAGFKGKELEETLVKVGDAVSAVGGGQAELEGVATALFQMSAKGKISAEEMSQMAERGIPVWQILADKMGKSVQQVMKMSEQGKLLADDVIPLLVDGMGTKFAGAMDKQSKSFNGMMSTMWDNIKMISGELAKPMFERMKKGLENVLPILDGLMSLLKGDFVSAVETVTKAFGQEKGLVISKFFLKIKEGVETARTAISNAKTFIEGIFALFQGNEGKAASLLSSLGLTPDQIYAIMDAVEIIKTTFTTGFNLIKGVITSFAPIVQTNFERILSVIGQVMGVVKPLVMDTFKSIKTWWDSNGAALAENVKTVFDGIWAVIQFVMPLIKVLIQTVFTAIKDIIKGGLNVISGAFKIFASLIKGDWSGLWDGIKQFVSGAIQLIWGIINLNFVKSILNLFKSFGSGAISFIKGMWDDIAKKFTSMQTSITNSVSGFFKGVVSWFTKMKDQAQTIFSLLRQFGEGVFTAFKNTVISVAQNIWSQVVSKFKGLKDGVVSLFNSLKSTSEGIFIKIYDVMTSPIKTATTFIKEQVDKIVGFFKGMNIKFPKIKLPHFSLKGEFSLKNMTVPSVGVDWYKNGGVFPANDPRMIGIGDASVPEAAIPLRDDVLGKIGAMIANTMPKQTDSKPVEQHLHFNVPVEKPNETARKSKKALQDLAFQYGI